MGSATWSRDRKENHMDVFNVGGNQAPKAPEGESVNRKNDTSRGSRGVDTSRDGSDSYATSCDSQRVTELVDQLVRDPEGQVRFELVDQFRSLLQVGEFDTPERAAKAADAILQGLG